MRIAKTLLSFNSAAPGAIIPLRSLISIVQIPGSLQLPKERLRVPPSVGLDYFDVPLAPLLSRLDAPALLALYTAMLCERRILFTSQSLSILTSCIHAAIAIFQPFEWQHIFVPVMHTPLLQFTCAPNPYIIGVTPSQFTAVNELYEIGEITLVALDDGYVVTLNGALPLVDLEGNTSHNNGTGVITYSGPKVSQERAAVKVASAGLNNISAASVLLATDAPVDLSMTATSTVPTNSSTLGDTEATQASIGRRDGAALAASAAAALASNKLHPTTNTNNNTAAANAAAVALEAVLSPFHTYNRSHAYDEEVVFARAHRRAYINRRIRARTLARERIGLLFSKPLTPKTENNGLTSPENSYSNDSIGREMSMSMPDDNVDMDSLVTHEHEESGTVSLAIDLINLTSTPGFVTQRRRGPKRNSANLSNLHTLGGIDSTKASTGGIKSLTAKMVSATMAGIAIATGSTTSCPGSRLAQEIKAIYARERKEGSWDEGAVYAAFLAFIAVVFGRITDFVYVEGTNDQAVRNGDVSPNSASLQPRFAKEEFVRYTIRHSTIAKLMEEAMNSQAIYTFACDYYLHSLTLRKNNPGNSNVATLSTPVTSTGNTKLNIIDLAMEAAIDPTLLSNPQNSIGANSMNTYNRSVSNVNTNNSNGLSYSSSTNGSGPGGLLNNHVSFSNIHKKLSATLAVLYEPLLDAIPGSLGLNGNPNIVHQSSLPPSSANSVNNNNSNGSNSSGTNNTNTGSNNTLGNGIAGTAHTIATALNGLYYAGMCVTATSYRSPNPLPNGLAEAGMPLIVTSLRTLLAAATTVGIQLEDPYTPSYIVKVAAAATHDPHLIHVVMGVIWSRLNDCTERHWQQGYKALALLYALLRVGSPRVAALAISYVPLLRFLVHPARIMAIRAGFAAETLSGQAESSTFIQCSNILSRNRRIMYTAGVSSIPGLNISSTVHPLSTVGPREGAHMVARQAARVYLLLSNPRRWLLERAIAVGPACVSNGVPLTLPFPYPLINLEAVGAPGASSLPPNWLPTPQQPIPPPYHETLAHATAEGNTNTAPYMIIHKQPRAATAPFDQIHKVGTPAIASSLSKYLNNFASQYNGNLQNIIRRPTYVYEAVNVMKKNAEDKETDGSLLSFRSMSEACRYPKAIHGHVSIGKAGSSTSSMVSSVPPITSTLPVTEITTIIHNADVLKTGIFSTGPTINGPTNAPTSALPPLIPSRPPLAPRTNSNTVTVATTVVDSSSVHPTHIHNNNNNTFASIGPTSNITHITAALPSPAPIKGPLREPFISTTFSPPGTLFSPGTNDSIYSPSSVSTVSPSPSRPIRTNLELDLGDEINSPPPSLATPIMESPTDQIIGINDDSNTKDTNTDTPIEPVRLPAVDNGQSVPTETLDERPILASTDLEPLTPLRRPEDEELVSKLIDNNNTMTSIDNSSVNEPFTMDNIHQASVSSVPSSSITTTAVSSVSSTTSTDEFISSLPVSNYTKPFDDTGTNANNPSYVSKSTASSAPSTPPITGIAVPTFSGTAALPDPSGGLGTSRPRATSRPTIAEIFGPLQERSPSFRSTGPLSTTDKSVVAETNNFVLNTTNPNPSNPSTSSSIPSVLPTSIGSSSRTLHNGIANGPGAVPINPEYQPNGNNLYNRISSSTTGNTSSSNNSSGTLSSSSLPPRTPKLTSSASSTGNLMYPSGGGGNDINVTTNLSPSFDFSITNDNVTSSSPSQLSNSISSLPSLETDKFLATLSTPSSSVPKTTTITTIDNNANDPFGFAEVALGGLSFVSPPPTITPLNQRGYRRNNREEEGGGDVSVDKKFMLDKINIPSDATTDGLVTKDKSTVDPFDLFDTFLASSTTTIGSSDNTNPLATSTTGDGNDDDKKQTKEDDPFALF